jgi:hypothetical protein
LEVRKVGKIMALKCSLGSKWLGAEFFRKVSGQDEALSGDELSKSVPKHFIS